MSAVMGGLGNCAVGVDEVRSFVVVYLNNSFVQVDYVFLEQNIQVTEDFNGVRSTPRLILAEITVFPIQAIKPAEIS